MSNLLNVECMAKWGGSAFVYYLFDFAPIVCGSLVLGLCFAALCAPSSFAIILLGKRELVALLLLGSECHVVAIVLCLFLAVPLVGWSVVYDCGISWSYTLTFCYPCEHTGKFQFEKGTIFFIPVNISGNVKLKCVMLVSV